MAAVRKLTVFTYQSGVAPSAYTFDVVYDENGLIFVRTIITPTGNICSTTLGLPQSVIDDINSAITQVTNIMAATSALNGFATFAAVDFMDVAFASPLASANYRVTTEVPSFVTLRIINKTVNGFRIDASAQFSGTVGWDLFL